jgi:Tol biopolymer transport system component
VGGATCDAWDADWDRQIRDCRSRNGQFVFGVSTGGLALSPDGSTLAFVASVDGRNGVWTRRLDETDAKFLSGTEGAGYVFWSPDGRSIGFATTNSVARIDLSSGAFLSICQANSLRGVAWAATDEIVFGSNASGLRRVPATGGTPEPLTELDVSLNEAFHGFPQFIDGNRFAYFARSESPDHTGVYVSSLDKPAERVFVQQTETNAIYGGGRDGSRYLLWTRGGTLLAQQFDAQSLRLSGERQSLGGTVGTAGVTGFINATASTTGVLVFSETNVTSQFTWFDRAGRPMGRVGESGDYHTFDVSPDGRRVIAALERPGGSDLWLIDTEREGLVTRLTARPANSIYPVFSPDGSQIAFGSGAMTNIFVRAAHSGGEAQRLSKSLRQQLPLDWTPDASAVLIYELAGLSAGRDLVVVPTTGNSPQPIPYLQTLFNEWFARFAPVIPARWIAYQSDESGTFEVHIDSYPKAGNRRRISVGGGQFPQWSADGRELFFVAPSYTLMAARITLRADSVESTSPQPLFRLPAVDTGRTPYRVAADGRRFLVRATPPGAAPPLTAIVNWPQMLRQ